VEEQLRAAWLLAVDAPGAEASVVEDAFERLLARHREPHRHYHTVKHLAYVLAMADELTVQVPVSDPRRVRLALFFHDAVYEPGAATNEADSAALARRELGDMGLDADVVDATADLIVQTAHEADPGDPDAGLVMDADAAVVMDADLAVLAAEPAVYAAYVAGVRAEYGHLGPAEWTDGRAAVLRRFLARPSIFHTVPMRAREPRARANLSAELVTLEEEARGRRSAEA
jgi:predicted metal-dependent HD superfamily phosphohydrolase